jgi:hypothetical protein
MAARKLLAVVEKKVDLPVEATQADGPSGLRQPVETLPSIPHTTVTVPMAEPRNDRLVWEAIDER